MFQWFHRIFAHVGLGPAKPKVGILVIGSLYWRNEPARESWRKSRLQTDDRILVKVPIRYGRKSKSGTYTMTFGPESSSGIAIVLPCRERGLSDQQLQLEAEALWGAEVNSAPAKNAIAKEWGCVGALFRDRQRNAQLVAAWTNFFRGSKGTPTGPVDADGLFNLPWPQRVDGRELDFDVLLATSNRETDTPAPNQIAQAWMEHDGAEEYFFENVKHGIRTADDAAIWKRMERGPDWLRRKEPRYPDAIAILCKEVPPLKLPRVRYFAPEVWGAVERFAHFYSSTYQFPPHIHGCVTGTTANFQRAERLRQVAVEMIPLLQEDRAELETNGFTHGAQGRKLTAIVEASITSLYSSVDAARKVVTHVFAKYQGLPESTRRTFHGAAEGKLDPKLPERIRQAFANALWYSRFRRLRDALTHIGPGSCHLDEQTGKVMYFHDAIREGDKVTHIPDIFAVLDDYFRDVNLFLGQVFTALLETLKDDEVWQICGIFDGRVYSRFVRPSEAKDMHSGRCDAFKWFELPENPRCPLADNCKAYERRKPPPPGAPALDPTGQAEANGANVS